MTHAEFINNMKNYTDLYRIFTEERFLWSTTNHYRFAAEARTWFFDALESSMAYLDWDGKASRHLDKDIFAFVSCDPEALFREFAEIAFNCRDKSTARLIVNTIHKILRMTMICTSGVVALNIGEFFDWDSDQLRTWAKANSKLQVLRTDFVYNKDFTYNWQQSGDVASRRFFWAATWGIEGSFYGLLDPYANNLHTIDAKDYNYFFDWVYRFGGLYTPGFDKQWSFDFILTVVIKLLNLTAAVPILHDLDKNDRDTVIHAVSRLSNLITVIRKVADDCNIDISHALKEGE